MTRAEIERANAAHNLEATRFVSAQDLEATQFVSMNGMRSATRRRNFLLPGIVVGLLLAVALLAMAYIHQEARPMAARAMPRQHQ